jgi:hypothetical protein
MGLANAFRERDTHLEVASVNINCPTTCKGLPQTIGTLYLIEGITRNGCPKREDTQNTLIVAMAEGFTVIGTSPFGPDQDFAVFRKFHRLFEKIRRSCSKEDSSSLYLLGGKFGVCDF